MRSNLSSRIAWALFATASIFTLVVQLITLFARSEPASLFDLLGSLILSLLVITFTFLAALILARHPGHTVGWLLMITGAASAFLGPVEGYVNQLPAPPASPGIFMLVLIWIQQFSWLVVVFPLLLVPLHFPTGQPPSPRWRWLVFLALGMGVFFIFIVTFSSSLRATSAGWQVGNPIGFLPDTLWSSWGTPFLIGLALLTLGSVAALFVRFRGSAPVERQQIKWLLYACTLFAAYYVFVPNVTAGLWVYFFLLLMLSIPLSIAISILRYRLWDIDLLIRRTLQYGALTALLALLYFGIVTVLQGIFTALGGSQSPVVTVISTLAIAALFNPLRRRLQNFIDQRFYRQKFDAEQTLLAFASIARSETDSERLTKSMMEIVQTAIQPERILIWLKSDARQQTQEWTKK